MASLICKWLSVVAVIAICGCKSRVSVKQPERGIILVATRNDTEIASAITAYFAPERGNARLAFIPAHEFIDDWRSRQLEAMFGITLAPVSVIPPLYIPDVERIEGVSETTVFLWAPVFITDEKAVVIVYVDGSPGSGHSMLLVTTEKGQWSVVGQVVLSVA